MLTEGDISRNTDLVFVRPFLRQGDKRVRVDYANISDDLTRKSKADSKKNPHDVVGIFYLLMVKSYRIFWIEVATQRIHHVRGIAHWAIYRDDNHIVR